MLDPLPDAVFPVYLSHLGTASTPEYTGLSAPLAGLVAAHCNYKVSLVTISII